MGLATATSDHTVSNVAPHLGSPARTRPPGLYVRVLLCGAAYAGVALLTGFGSNTVGGAESDLAEAFGEVPERVTQALVGMTQVLASLVPLALITVLVVRQRWLRAATVVAVWPLSVITYDLVDAGFRDRPGDLLLDELLPRADAFGVATFPSPAWVAGAVALVLFAAPELPGAWRRTAIWALALVAALRVASGTALALDMMLAWVHGWTVAVLVGLVVGVPTRLPRPEELIEALAENGVEVSDLRLASAWARPGRLVADSPDGPVFLKVRSVDERDADRIYGLYKRARFQGLGDERVASDLRALVEHEALASWAAERAGVRTPATNAMASVGEDAVVLVRQAIEAVPLDRIRPSEIEESVTELWQQVALLRRHRIAHRALRPSNVLVDRSGAPWITDFSNAVVGADTRALDLDVVELLVSLSLVADVDVVVRAANAALGAPTLARVLRLLQPAALTGSTRAELRRNRALLEDIRTSVIDVTDTDVPPLEQLQRITPRNFLGLAVAFLALYVLLPQLGDLQQTIDAFGDADVRWVPFIIGASFATFAAATMALLGAVPQRLPIPVVARAQIASAFVGKLGPANVGGLALNVRMLQRAGVESAVGSAAVGLMQLTGFAAHVLLFAGFVAWSGRTDVEAFTVPDTRIVVGAAIVVALTVVVAISPFGRQLLRPMTAFIRSAASAIVRVFRDPRRVIALFVGSTGVTLLNLIALYLTLQAFGGGAEFPRVGVAYLAAAAVANVSPTPGGLGPLEASLVALLTGAGVPGATAVSVTLAFRLATYWLPIPFGWLAFRTMQRRQEV
ncbi:MAG: lysylphosphatidylglycerol synthase transmembrane domain-containing protein [Actinomycetota bacterium]